MNSKRAPVPAPALPASRVVLAVAVLLLLLSAAGLSALTVARRSTCSIRGLKSAVDRARAATPGAAGSRAVSQCGSGDIIFLMDKRTVSDRSNLAKTIIIHAGLLMEHPQHGVCVLEAWAYDPRDGRYDVPRRTRFSSCTPDVFQGHDVRIGTVRVTKLPDFLRCTDGCAYVRHADRRLTVNVAAVWDFVERLNDSPLRLISLKRDTITYVARYAGWVARIALGRGAPEWVPHAARRTYFCTQFVAVALAAGGLWGYASNQVDGALEKLAPQDSELFRSNCAVVGATSDDQLLLKPYQCMPVDLSVDSPMSFARLMWKQEELLGLDNQCHFL